MALSTNRANVRDLLKIDPSGKVWGNSLLNRFINEGNREIINDPDIQWGFQETRGYLIPQDDGLTEILRQDDDLPEGFFSKSIKQFKELKASQGNFLTRDFGPKFNNSTGAAPSGYTDYAEKIFLNAGYDSAASYTTLHNMDTIGGDGTWAAVNAEVTTVATDASTFKEGAGSVSFDIDVSGSTNNYGEIENTTFAGVDISAEVLNEGGIILWVYLTENVNFNEISVFFGSDSSNFHKVRSYNDDVQGNAYKSNDWNRIFIPTVRRSTTGTPDLSSVDYLRVRLGYDNAQTDQTTVRVDGIQYVDKYVQYLYARSATDMTSDTDESVIPNQYEFVIEKYAEWKCWSQLSGREDKATQAFQEYSLFKNRMKRELTYTHPEAFQMKTPRKYG